VDGDFTEKGLEDEDDGHPRLLAVRWIAPIKRNQVCEAASGLEVPRKPEFIESDQVD